MSCKQNHGYCGGLESELAHAKKYIASLREQVRVMKSGLEKLRDGPGNKMTGWKTSWACEYSSRVLSQVSALDEPKGDV